MGKRAFIIGGSGQIGRAICAKLLSESWEVILASRGEREIPTDLLERGAKTAVLDREQRGELAKALSEGADAVIDTVAYDAAHSDQLLDVSGSVGQFVVISSASVYRDEDGRTLDEARDNGFPHLPEFITEEQPTVAPGPETYSTRKVAMERRMLDDCPRPVSVLRPCAIHGPHSTHPREWWFVKRMRDERQIIPLRNARQGRFHTTAAENIAELTAVALSVPENRILNIADPYAPNVFEIGSTIARTVGWEGELREISDGQGEANVGWTPWSIPAAFTLSTEAARKKGYQPATDYSRAVPSSCEWLWRQPSEGWEKLFPVLAAYRLPLFDYESEDAFLSLWRQYSD